MKLLDIFEQLSVGEFAQLAIGNEGSGLIKEKDQEKLVPHINLGLTAIYKRFNLKEGRLTLMLVPDKLTYDINSRFAMSNGDSLESVKYLLDEDEPFYDDVLKIERVLTSSGFNFPLNDGTEIYSVHTPSMTKLRVPAGVIDKAPGLPRELMTDTLELVYRANHPKLGMPDGMWVDLEQLDVELPDSHLEALLYFVASRIHNPIGMTNEFHAGNTYYAKYLAACQELENQNLQTDRTGGNTRAQRNGWA